MLLALFNPNNFEVLKCIYLIHIIFEALLWSVYILCSSSLNVMYQLEKNRDKDLRGCSCEVNWPNRWVRSPTWDDFHPTFIWNLLFLIFKSSPPEVFCKKGVLRSFAKFTGNTCARISFFNRFVGLRPATLLKQRPWHRCFPVNFGKFLRTSFLQNTSGRLLL